MSYKKYYKIFLSIALCSFLIQVNITRIVSTVFMPFDLLLRRVIIVHVISTIIYDDDKTYKAHISNLVFLMEFC